MSTPLPVRTYHSHAIAVCVVATILLPKLVCAGPVIASPAATTVFEQSDDANYHIPNLVVALGLRRQRQQRLDRRLPIVQLEMRHTQG